MQHPSQFMGAPESSDPLYRYLSRFVSPGRPLVDLGSGRGRWLDFACRTAATTWAVDEHEPSVAEARRRGHRGVIADAFEFLKKTPEKFGTITALHLVEHLKPSEVGELFELVYARLEPAGRFIVVTPNFKDWAVASEVFWVDPTHVRPYPLLLLSAYAEEVGLQPTFARSRNLVTAGYRSRISRLWGQVRYGKSYGHGNAILVAERPA